MTAKQYCSATITRIDGTVEICPVRSYRHDPCCLHQGKKGDEICDSRCSVDLCDYQKCLEPATMAMPRSDDKVDPSHNLYYCDIHYWYVYIQINVINGDPPHMGVVFAPVNYMDKVFEAMRD